MSETGLVVIGRIGKEQEDKLRQEIAPVIAQARSLIVVSADDFKVAGDFLKNTKTAQKRVEEFFAPLKESAHQAHKKICDAEKSFLDPLRTAERDIKGKLGRWQAEQDLIAATERARLQAEVEAQARKEREKLEERARKAAEKGQAEKAEALKEQAEEVVAPVIEVQSAAPRVEGISTRQVWKAEVVNKREFIGFAAKDPTGMFLAMITVNEMALKRLANGEKAPEIPGIKFRRETQVSSRGN